MIDVKDIDAIIGADVMDTANDRIGRVSQVYIDSEDQHPSWVSVRTGFFGRSETLIPIDDARWESSTLFVQVDRSKVREAPHVDPDQELSIEEQTALYRYYGKGAPADDGAAPADEAPQQEPAVDAPMTDSASIAETAPVAETVPAADTAPTTEAPGADRSRRPGRRARSSETVAAGQPVGGTAQPEAPVDQQPESSAEQEQAPADGPVAEAAPTAEPAVAAIDDGPTKAEGAADTSASDLPTTEAAAEEPAAAGPEAETEQPPVAAEQPAADAEQAAPAEEQAAPAEELTAPAADVPAGASEPQPIAGEPSTPSADAVRRRSNYVEPEESPVDAERSSANDGEQPEVLTRYEERLRIGTERVPAERVRLVKRIVTEHRTVSVPVSHEELHLEREPIGEDEIAGWQGPVSELQEEEREIVLMAERPVVSTHTAPIERIRIVREVISGTHDVEADLRHEQFDLDRGNGGTAG